MKILIVYMSYHHMNTEKIARAMAEVTGATLSKADEVDPGDLAGYDLIGFGSGIYGGKHHTSILALADEMPPMEKPVFPLLDIGRVRRSSILLRRNVITKGCTIINEFHCPGEATFLKFIRVNKGRPDEQDLENARTFAKGLLAAPGAEKQE